MDDAQLAQDERTGSKKVTKGTLRRGKSSPSRPLSDVCTAACLSCPRCVHLLRTNFLGGVLFAAASSGCGRQSDESEAHLKDDEALESGSKNQHTHHTTKILFSRVCKLKKKKGTVVCDATADRAGDRWGGGAQVSGDRAADAEAH